MNRDGAVNTFNSLILSIKCVFAAAVALTICSFSFGQTSFGTIENIDQELLNTFIVEEVNKYRKKVKADPVVVNSAFRDAAQDHSNYMRKKCKITHFQWKRIKRTPKNRVDFYGAKFESVGENVQVNNLNLGADLNEKNTRKSSLTKH